MKQNNYNKTLLVVIYTPTTHVMKSEDKDQPG